MMKKIFARLEELAAITDEPGLITRTFLSPAMQRANALVGDWMKELGCEVSVDGWGNLIGHLPGDHPEAKTLLIGSHLDTVRNAGKYDGPLGVLAALETLDQLIAAGIRLPFHVDVLGFSDEEGTRFHSAYLGSKALAGLLTEADLDLRDDQGITVREAVASFQKTERVRLPRARYRSDQLLGYLEVHIEQGPVLEKENQALGVVDYIAAQNRFVYTFEGRAGHAGTTPMNLRRDALTGAAEFVLAIETMGLQTPGLVATVGQLNVGPGVSNVIPDKVRLSLDIRHADAKILQASSKELQKQAKKIAKDRNLAVSEILVQGTDSVPCSPRLIEALDKAVKDEQGATPHLISGAGHDGVVLSQLTDIGMLFVRCRDGLSHHPAESVTEPDVAAACSALAHCLRHLS